MTRCTKSFGAPEGVRFLEQSRENSLASQSGKPRTIVCELAARIPKCVPTHQERRDFTSSDKNASQRGTTGWEPLGKLSTISTIHDIKVNYSS